MGEQAFKQKDNGFYIDNANNLVFWCHFLNKLEPWHDVYIMQQ